MAPAQQGPGADAAPRCQLDPRPKHEPELIGRLERRAEVAQQLEAARVDAVLGRRANAHGAAQGTRVLGRAVARAQDVARGGLAEDNGRDPDRGADREPDI
jgi:hypothetical protein